MPQIPLPDLPPYTGPVTGEFFAHSRGRLLTDPDGARRYPRPPAQRYPLPPWRPAQHGVTPTQRQYEPTVSRMTGFEALSKPSMPRVLPPLEGWSAPTEPKPRTYQGAGHRKHSRWPDIGHRTFVLVSMVITVATLFAIQRLVWPNNAVRGNGLGSAWSGASLLWLSALMPAACELTGLLMYQNPKWPKTVKPISQIVSWRIVSRGLNTQALTATILRCRAESQANPLFRYVIEVVTDTSHDGLPAPAPDLHYIRVPKNYETPRGTRNKARALNFALHYSPLPDNAWIVHLDEESQPTRSMISGIARMIAEEEDSGELRIGQGVIVYHRDWKSHPFFTLSDCIRTGSDLGRLFFSMRIGVPLFGLHGSYIIVRNDVEKEVGFDVGPEGSITEDAFWGYQQMETGRRCRWVDGYLEEQCTQSLPDFMKQRRRWFTGLVKVATQAPVKLRWRFVLGVSMLAWALAPLVWGYTIAHFITGGYVDPVVRALANGSFAVYIVTTLVGLRVNMNEHGINNPLKRLGWCVTWLCCMPVFSLIESASVDYALARPATGFHVVRK
jgi:egghead protein (zeste-white 4 protein)